MKTDERYGEEYFNKLNSKLNEKDIILNRNIEYSFILEQEINTLKQKINTKEQKVKDLKQEIKTKEKTIAKLKNENKLIKSTISWRITKPLRHISKLIK